MHARQNRRIDLSAAAVTIWTSTSDRGPRQNISDRSRPYPTMHTPAIPATGTDHVRTYDPFIIRSKLAVLNHRASCTSGGQTWGTVTYWTGSNIAACLY